MIIEETNKFGRNKVAYSADTGRRVDHPENFVSQSSTKSVLSYFNVHAVLRNSY